MTLTPASGNVIKLFWHNYTTVCVTSVKNMRKYADNGIDLAKKLYDIDTNKCQFYKTFFAIITPLSV